MNLRGVYDDSIPIKDRSAKGISLTLCHWVVEANPILLWERELRVELDVLLILGEAGMLKEKKRFPLLI